MIDLPASIEARHRQHHDGCVKTWEDLDRYEHVINVMEPDLIVECGTFSGKSALWFARTARCPVITIDVTPYVDPGTREAWADHDITLITGSTTDPTVVAMVHATAADYERVLVVLDSDHSHRHVHDEMVAYAPLAPSGGWMVVEDGILRWFPEDEKRPYTGDPIDAIVEYLAEHDGWEIDTELEDLHPVTLFPYGWLRRV